MNSINIVKMVLEYNSKSDPRADIFNYIVSKEWILLKMNLVKENLEGIFRELTSSNNE